MSEELQVLNCPACGAPVTPLQGQSTMQCPFCHNTIKIAEVFPPGGKQEKPEDLDAEDEEEEKSPKDPLIEYLKARVEDDLSYLDEEISSPSEKKDQSHTWGRSQVPAGFEGITTLGPVVIICDPKKVHIPPQAGTPRISRLMVYRDGFAYQAGDTDVRAWRFNAMTAIWSDEVKMFGIFKNDFTLVRATGESLILDTCDVTWFREPGDRFYYRMYAARDSIKLGLFKLLVPGVLQQYEAGKALTFGPVTVQKSSGLQLGGNHYAWGDIKDIHVSKGRLTVNLDKHQQADVRVCEIPNFELLYRLIGVDMQEMEKNMAINKK
jgi:uncharacterized Zn finger protein (UPF0148 family)